ncbi:uncharacterized protein, partial [Mycetomoellerius zeteki]|uniref:uncharacterized protein n=1 Tax=Mycetomoellerius zeteki TaxID=64791 RepID=UPI00084E3E7B
MYALAVVAEPARTPENGKWLTSADDPPSAAITWRWSDGRIPCRSRCRGERFVAVDWGEMTVVSCYFPPSLSYAEFARDMDNMDRGLREVLRRGHPTIIAGDFNARAQAWDLGRPNRRGDFLMGWMGLRGLHLINVRGEPTCVHPRGTSSVDVALATSAAARKITGWRVATELESLSDHRYILMDIGSALIGTITGGAALRIFPRWVTRNINRDLMEAAAIFHTWEGGRDSVIRDARRLDEILRDISDVAMARKGPTKRPSVYWWNEEIAELRRVCNARRRKLTRARSRPHPEDARPLWDGLREARRNLRRAINSSKAKLWKELVDDLDRDPWGTPYRLVTKKLVASGATIVETIPPDIADNIVASLFPTGDTSRNGEETLEWLDEYKVTHEEVLEASANIKNGKAPGPDGIPGQTKFFTKLQILKNVKIAQVDKPFVMQCIESRFLTK